MLEIKIYRDGKYDRKANLTMKAKNLVRDKVAPAVDSFFENH